MVVGEEIGVDTGRVDEKGRRASDSAASKERGAAGTALVRAEVLAVSRTYRPPLMVQEKSAPLTLVRSRSTSPSNSS